MADGSDAGGNSDPAANTREIVHPDPEQALYGFRHAPCFRESAMYSIVIASGFTVLEVMRKRPPYAINNRLIKMSVPAPEAMFLGTLVPTALGTWFLCRHQLRERRDKMHEALKYRSINKEHEDKLAADGTSVSAETKDGGGLGGGMTSLESPPSGAPLGASDATSPTPQKKSWW
eukprot:CAMPEP_0179424444 /NCGR_PEP_ID=MMETSP0799-20121207/11591_1 /TAXON_ID=46947 /ORGANISM="Geminigera cryophila, Strain CCMP2564" /LENGTH=174 /DNA_ID=CAMNT_0021198895 /DNA_START=35 /DNA_END=556 /DNA_ORIENTATION=+